MDVKKKVGAGMEAPEWVIATLCWGVLLCMLGWLAVLGPLLTVPP